MNIFLRGEFFVNRLRRYIASGPSPFAIKRFHMKKPPSRIKGNQKKPKIWRLSC